MEDRKRPRLNRETVDGARVILLAGTGYWSQSVLKQIRIRTKTGSFNFSRMGEMREQRMISLKNHVGGEKGSPVNSLMEKGIKSGVKRERKPARLHKYSGNSIFMISGWRKEMTTFQNRKGMRSV